MTFNYPHMCRDEHQEIGHRDSEHERCPLCRASDMADALRRHMAKVEAEVAKVRGAQQTQEAALREIGQNLRKSQGNVRSRAMVGHSYYKLPDDIEHVISIADNEMRPEDVLMGKVDPRRVAHRLIGEIRGLQMQVARLKRENDDLRARQQK